MVSLLGSQRVDAEGPRSRDALSPRGQGGRARTRDRLLSENGRDTMTAWKRQEAWRRLALEARHGGG